jgi:SSS family solute:Na+ symporter
MEVSLIDIIIFVGFYAFVVSFSLWKSRSGSAKRNSSDYFLAGRGLTWPLIGISIVAANISTEQFVGMSGQGAGSVGLAVSVWQLMGSLYIVLIAFTLLPRFLKAGIYTMPEFLEYRYDGFARSTMALLTVVIYIFVLITAVLYSGGITLRTIFGFPLATSVWGIGIIATIYTAWGGLKAVAWADLFQGLALLIGGLFTFFLGLNAVGGWDSFAAVNKDSLHLILPASDPTLPWTGVLSGMWIVMIYYCGLNQFIVQRNLAAKSLKDGQLGVIFAGALWLLVPIAIVIPGIISNQLYGSSFTTADEAYPTLIRELIPNGFRGFMFAAIAGAVISSLASMLNSASTIFSMDVYKRLLRPKASETSMVITGRIVTVVAIISGCLIAPILDDPKFGGVFTYIQQFQGYIWPGVVAAFTMAFVLKKAPSYSGTVAIVSGPFIYGLFQQGANKWHDLHFLTQVFLTYAVICILMLCLTIINPRKEPYVLPEREDLDTDTGIGVKIAGGLVVAGVACYFIIFW